MKTVLSLVLFLSLIFFSSCARPPSRQPTEIQTQRMFKISKPPASIQDDIGLENLAAALDADIERLEETDNTYLQFGSRRVLKINYIISLQYLEDKIRSGASEKELKRFITENFDFYKVEDKNKNGNVFITSYFEPVIEGSRKKTATHSQPLYKVPDNLVTIDLGKFVDKFERLSVLKDNTSTDNLRFYGRLVKKEWGSSYTIVPYYTREEIDSSGALAHKGLELAWVDPVDAFFMHIQGSGTVKFSDGSKVRLGYASQNGQPYYAIGRYLKDVIPEDKMSMQSIEKYLRSLPDIEMKNILYKNPSYIFFTKLKGKPVTSFGTEVVDGRTIATDRNYYPKGTLAYMTFKVPVFKDKESAEPYRWEAVSRFVLDQDSGGAINGANRVDLYWGSGDEAGRHAGVMKNWGELYYLVPKSGYITDVTNSLEIEVPVPENHPPDTE